MAAANSPWADDWIVGVRAWVERRGQVVLGKGRHELLQAINQTRSISAAARQMGMSYRRAWVLVQSMNEAAAEPLVKLTVGGRHGGGARLTPRGQAALALFGRMQGDLNRTASGLWPRLTDQSEATSVHVAAAISLQDALGLVLADYAQRKPAVKVRVLYGASDELAYHLMGGTCADLFLAAASGPLDRLGTAGLLQPKSRVVLAENSLLAIAATGRPMPVRAPADLVHPALRRIALAAPDCPLGDYARSWLASVGLQDLQSRAIVLDNAVSILGALRAGQADVGLIYASDLARAEDMRILFRIRDRSLVIRYEAALLSCAHSPEQAQSLLAYLHWPQATARFRACGLVPPRQRKKA